MVTFPLHDHSVILIVRHVQLRDLEDLHTVTQPEHVTQHMILDLQVTGKMLAKKKKHRKVTKATNIRQHCLEESDQLSLQLN